MRQRFIVAFTLLPIGLAAIALGGFYYFAIVALLLTLAGWEFAKLFQVGGFKTSRILVAGGVLALSATRFFYGLAGDPFAGDGRVLSVLILITAIVYVIAYERGGDQSGTDLVTTLGGILYIGFLGSYLFALRMLPDGVWWVLTVLPAVWFADSAAYFIGKPFGRKKFSPRLSPKKTWEGYIAGIVLSPPLTAAFVFLWEWIAKDPIMVTPVHGLIFGLVLGVLAPVGDLVESLFKRQVNIKDSSNLLPGHGGAFDRIDSWLWAAAIGYYLIQFFFLS